MACVGTFIVLCINIAVVDVYWIIPQLPAEGSFRNTRSAVHEGLARTRYSTDY